MRQSKRQPIKVNQNQLHTLQLVYTFRFVSIALLARLRQVSNTTVNRAINTLVTKGLLHRRYDKATYTRFGLPAAFSLTPAGTRLLNQHGSVHAQYAHSQYDNTRVEDSFVNHCLDILRSYILLAESYPDTFTIFTRPEILDFADRFPAPLPNLYLQRNQPSEQLPDHYLLDILTNYAHHLATGRQPRTS